MSKKGNPNINLSHKLTVEEQRAGGRASGKVRREKKTMQTILNSLLDCKCSEVPKLSDLAKKMGLSDASVKELYARVALLNTLKKANFDDLKTLCGLIGEVPSIDGNNEQARETLAKIKECAYNDGQDDRD